MDNNNLIKVYINNQFVDVNYDFFINEFIKTKFHINNRIVIEKFLFDVLKIEDKDKERIINSFRNEVLKIEKDLINNQNSQDYIDRLYEYLKNINFHSADNDIKIKILTHLKVKQYLFQKIITDFSKNT